jgi:hypothetical protein
MLYVYEFWQDLHMLEDRNCKTEGCHSNGSIVLFVIGNNKKGRTLLYEIGREEFHAHLHTIA